MAFCSPFSASHTASSSGPRPISLLSVVQVCVHRWSRHSPSLIISVVWAATTNDLDFLRSEGLKQTINDPIHRQEIVAAGIAPFLLTRKNDILRFLYPLTPCTEYREAITRISDHAGELFEALSRHQQRGIPVAFFFEEILRALPEACFLLCFMTPLLMMWSIRLCLRYVRFGNLYQSLSRLLLSTSSLELPLHSPTPYSLLKMTRIPSLTCSLQSDNSTKLPKFPTVSK